MKCPTELTNKTGCIRADEHELFGANNGGLSQASKIVIGVTVPVGFSLGALLTIWAFLKLRKRSKPTPPSKPSDPSNPDPFEKSDIGITKVYEQYYLELDSRPILYRKEIDRKPPRHIDFLLGLEPIPSPSLGMRHSMVMEKMKQELEGSPTTREMQGDTLVGEGVIGQAL